MTFNFNFENELKKARNTPEYHTVDFCTEFILSVKQYLKKNNLKQKDLAKKMGTSSTYVSNFLSGNENMTALTMVKVALALDCKISSPELCKDIDENNWQPIKTAPKDGTLIWAFARGGKMQGIVCWVDDPYGGSIHRGYWRGVAMATSTPTHWRPLPEPPNK